jgi:hypothetical protein
MGAWAALGGRTRVHALARSRTVLAISVAFVLFAFAVIVVRLVPKNWAGLRSAMLRPLVVCGQRSLEVFCLGIFLSFVGHFILEMYSEKLVSQVAVSGAGLMLMTCVAFYRTWSRSLDAPAAAKRAATVAEQRRDYLQIQKETVT